MKLRIVILLYVVLCCASLRAQEKIDPAFELIDPFLKENTYLVVHVDLKAIDFDALAAKFKPQMMEGAETAIRFGAKFQGKEDDEEFLTEARKQAEMLIDAQIAQAKSVFQSIRDAGVENVFFLGMLETLQTFPVIMAIPGEPGFSDEVNDFIRLAFAKAGFADDMSFYVLTATDVSPAAIVMPIVTPGAAPPMSVTPTPAAPKYSPERFMDTLRRARTKYRLDINAALHLQRKSPIRVVLAPSSNVKTFAQLGGAFVEFNSATSGEEIDQQGLVSLIKDFESLSVGIDPVQMRFNIAGQFPSEESAEKARKFFAGLAAGVEDEQLRILVHEFLPKVNKKRLILILQQEHFDKLSATASAMMAAQMAAAQAEMQAETLEGTPETGDSEPPPDSSQD